MSYNELIQRGTPDFPIELYSLDENHPRYEMASHWHSEIELVRIIQGEFNIKLDSNEYTAKKGDIIFINAEIIHCGMPKKGCIYECIVMNFDAVTIEDSVCKLFIEDLLSHDIHVAEFHRSSDSEFNKAINSLFDSLYIQKAGYKFSVLAAIYKLLAVIMSEKLYVSASNTLSSNNKSILKLKKVLSYIRDNYDKPITLGEMSSYAKMSPRYFCNFFKQMTKKTPVEYLIFYRIECASRKLINTNLNITDVALSCGFNDLSYFIKTFKAYKGISPSKFRKLNLF